jgi:hypothetical protein
MCDLTDLRILMPSKCREPSDGMQMPLCVIFDFGYSDVRGPFEKFVDWRQCAAVMQREAVTVVPSYSGGGNVVVA